MRRLCLLALLVAGLPLALPAAEPRPAEQPIPERLRTADAAPPGWQLTGWAFGLRAQKEEPKAEEKDAPKGEEAKDTYGRGLVVPKDLKNRVKLSHRRNLVLIAGLKKATAASYDMRALGLVPPIKNQGSCGSCWAFSGLCAAESAHIRAGRGTKDNTAWSEQSVLDCGRNGGCNGDWMETALEQARNSGVSDTADYPYTGRPANCRNVPHDNQIDDFGYVGTDDGVPPTQAIKDAIENFGAVAVAVAADGSFANYRSGIFKGSGSRGINHAVNLVGWQDDKTIPSGGYWIMRNSWGTGWGEAGYMRISYGANLIGYGAVWARVNAPAPDPNPPVPPVPPIPPVPPGKGFTGALIYKDGALVAVTAGGVSVEDDLKAAGLDPALIADVLKLLQDIRTKQPRDVILADILKIFSHFAAP